MNGSIQTSSGRGGLRLSLVIAAMALVVVAGITGEPPARAALTFTVNDTGDAPDLALDGVCETGSGNGICTLRAAIEEANNSAGADNIFFAIGGAPPYLISAATNLPAITDEAVLDATTQAGYAGTPLVQIASALSASSTLVVAAGGDSTVIRGLQIDDVSALGVIGIKIEAAVTDVSVEANHIFGPYPGCACGQGIWIDGAGNTVGGTTAAQRNVISDFGIGVEVRGDDNTISGNYIGTDAAGTSPRPNNAGIESKGENNTIGGTMGTTPGGACTGACNLISASWAAGIGLTTTATDNVVIGNYIGTDVTGSVALPHPSPYSGEAGILMSALNNGTTIGGATPAERNVVSGHVFAGIHAGADTAAVTVRGNYIGLNAAGTAGIPNGVGINAVRNAIIGGTAPGEGNVIAYNTFDGIRMLPPDTDINNAVRGNSIYSNGDLGIDINDDGVTANDSTDPDTGPNGLQNYPVVTAAYAPAATTDIHFSLNSTPSTTFTVDFYANDACDSSGFGEGKKYLASSTVTTDASGDLTAPGFLSLGTSYLSKHITATATDPSGSTSEFSMCRVVTCGDLEFDGFGDCQQLLHRGPTNADTAFDSCPLAANNPQMNTDGNHVDHSPPYTSGADDKTWVDSDAAGDACDDDDDNDGITDADEATGAACSGKVTDPVLRDTDGDRFLDGAECALGTDPTSNTLKPLVSACGPPGDADADKFSDRIEFCFYGSDPGDTDTDDDRTLDGGKDGCEVASVNGDRVVNSGDQGMLAGGISGAFAYHVNVDLNKDGVLNSGDQGLMASFIVPSGQCPG